MTNALGRGLLKVAVLGALVLAPASAFAYGGFSNVAYTATKSYDDWDCQYVSDVNYDSQCEDRARSYSAYLANEWVYYEWYTDPVASGVEECYFCSRETGYLSGSYGPNRADMVFSYPANASLPTTIAQQTAFQEWEIVNHTLTCYTGSNNVCSKKWDSDGEIDAIEMRDSCNPADSVMFTQIPGGTGIRGVLRGAMNYWDKDGSYGTNVYFVNQSSSLKSTFTTRQPQLTDGRLYNLAGYSHHHEASMCSEAQADVFNLSTPYAHSVELPLSRVSATMSAVMSNVYDNCMGTLHSMDVVHSILFSIFCSSRSSSCNEISREVVNAFLNVPQNGSSTPVARAITAAGDGVTGPPTLFCALKGSCPSPVSNTLGRISYWSGKVNTHKTGSSWTWDTDCSSGANISPLTYCRKFWPSTVSYTQVSLTTKPSGVWKTGGCGSSYSGNGVTEYTCNGN
jgi:hypothetical protein